MAFRVSGNCLHHHSFIPARRLAPIEGAGPGMPLLRSHLLIVLAATAAMASLPAQENQPGPLAAQVALSPEEYDLWQGEWISRSSNLKANLYAIVRIVQVDADGVKYESECRDIPYGPNATFVGDQRALFLGPRVAQNPETGVLLSLRIEPDDRHERILEFLSAPCVLRPSCSA